MKHTFIGVILALSAAIFGAWVANTYISRLPDHRGLFLVSVADTTSVPLASPPRHTVVIVIDGLRRDGAQRLAASQLIAEHGQCFTTDVGRLSVSRPVYAELSTGLEQDRTGSRNNDETSPLHVASLWETARVAGRTVDAVSELPWWRELFPRGFDRYEMPKRDENFFARTLTADLTLIHPIYVDETAHAFGGVSAEYTAAVDRVDAEVSPFLRDIDWQRDLVVFTADHGHRARGGHGAPADDIEFVLTCMAGRGVVHDTARGTIETKTLAPLLSVLLGLPFPSQMRAGDDGLDAMWKTVRELPSDYLADRQRAVERFREANARAVKGWGEASGSWRAFYATRHARQTLEWMGAALVAFSVLAWRKRAGARVDGRWLLAVLLTMVGLEIAFRGSFDFNAINQRNPFLVGTIAAAGLTTLLGAYAQRFLSRASLREDQTLLVAFLVWLNLAHLLIYGWPIGFPLPNPVPFFLPFVSGLFLMVGGMFLALLLLFRRRP